MKKIAVMLLVGAAFVGGFGYGRWYGKSVSAAGTAGGSAPKLLYWVDPMHPWYKADKPGTAPDCGMKLVAVYEGDERDKAGKHEGKQAPGTVRISAAQQQLIGLESSRAQYETVTGSIHAAARVTLDETKIAKVQTKLEGWIDKVFVDFTGKLVHQGDPLLTVYSPEALGTQLEYLLAIKAQHMMHDNPVHDMASSTDNMAAAARKRLELWDITDRQIDEITASGKPMQNLTLDSPISGFVMERNAFPKMHVTPETALYTVADLSTVWVIADVFEYEAADVRLNAPATLTLSYLPGREFHGRVSYILPQVDPVTRTLKVRIQFDNPGFALKPDMYGQVEMRTAGARRLVVPETAVLNSGDRQVVFLDHGDGNYEPRNVKLGAQADGHAEILSGLDAGDRVVTSGNFLIDSESRLK